jgi:hypothetical protein
MVFLLHTCGARGYVGVLCSAAHCRHCSKSLDEKYFWLTVIGDVHQRCMCHTLYLNINITTAVSDKKVFRLRPSTGQKFHVKNLQYLLEKTVTNNERKYLKKLHLIFICHLCSNFKICINVCMLIIDGCRSLLVAWLLVL